MPLPATPDEFTVAPGPRWIDTQEALGSLVRELDDEPRLGLDTEFHRERTYWPHCALVQVAWSSGTALVDPLSVDLRGFAPLLGGRTVVMHAAAQDLEVFQRDVGVVPDDLFDTQVAASFLGMNSIGLAPLVLRLLEERLPKADRLADWTTRPLGDDAREYAEADVRHLFALHDILLAQLEARGRIEWMASESRSLIERTLRRPDPETLWWRVKEARRLRGRAAAIAQELAAWRDAHAAEIDRPVRTVLPDLALAGIAQRPPDSAEALTQVRGLRERGLARAARSAILDAIERGKRLSLDAVRYPEERPVDPELRPLLPLLTAWASQRCRELELDPAVVATRGDLEDFLRDDPSGRLNSGWRAEALAADLRGFLDGRVTLRYAQGTGLVLESWSGTD